MLFPTVTFAAFFVVVLAGNWALRARPVAWKQFMLVASYVFYGYWDWRFLALLAASTVTNEVLAVAIARSSGDRRRVSRLVAGGVAANLVTLGFFKYYGFFVTSLVNALHPFSLDPPLPLLQLVLPIGISFFTFQAISYLVDVSRHRVAPAPLLDFALYLSFFPHLVAGPVVRASEFLPQVRRTRDPDRVDATRAALLIGRGLFKKVVIATYLQQEIVDRVFANPGSYSSIETLAGIYGFAAQIYADFSGYTDIAIGLALLLGVRFPDNFNRPYAAVSIQDFWRRWHITLSRWLRDYLYIPLGGNRGRRWHSYRNLVITMVLGGLWHGARGTFIAWGAFHGVGLAAERWVRDRREAEEPVDPASLNATQRLALLYSGPRASYTWQPEQGRYVLRPVPPRRHPWLARIATFHFVCLGWVLFRAESLSAARAVVGRVLTGGFSTAAIHPMVVVAIAATIVVQYMPDELGVHLQAWASRLSPTAQGFAFGTWLFVIDVLGPQGVAPFIYFQF